MKDPIKRLEQIPAENFQKDVFIMREWNNEPLIIRVDKNTWTFILQAKTNSKLQELLMQTSKGEMKIKIENILLEN